MEKGISIKHVSIITGVSKLESLNGKKDRKRLEILDKKQKKNSPLILSVLAIIIILLCLSGELLGCQ
jgi:hypothetical protein